MTTPSGSHAMQAPALVGLAVAWLLACASEEQSEAPDEHATTSGGLEGHGGALNIAGRPVTISGGAGSAAGGAVTGKAGVGGNGSGGHAGSSPGHGASAGSGGKTAGGTGSGGNGGSSGASGGAGGSLNQPTQCDEATAVALGAMSSNIKVNSNVCLKMTLPTDQTWIKKITMQPDSGMYPLPFTWSNCGTNSSGAFTANYMNVVLDPVSAQCPVLVKLGGNGAPINVQWWGG